MEQPVAPRKYNPELPLHIERAVLKALAKQRTERHADVSAFIEALRTSINSKIRTYLVSQPTTSDPVPKTKEQWMNKGNVCFKAKHYVDALAAYEEVIQFDPGDAYAYNCKGLTLEQMQREQEALLAYEKAVWLDSNYIQAWYNK
jgi:tetratricopeptide (TPR) repeat protein